MIRQEAIAGALGPLIRWLEAWRDECGAYHGYVVHRTETKRMKYVHDTAWTQSAMIRGYGNLLRKSNQPRWREPLLLSADLLANRYDPHSGKVKNTGHEDERFQSLGSCALAVCALLSVVDLVDAERRTRYIQVSSDHVSRYWQNVLWSESEGAFRFAEVDYYSPQEDRFVVNFNALAAEALLALHRETGKSEFRLLALRAGRWLSERWNSTRGILDQILAGRKTIADDPLSPWMPPGGFPYQFTPSQRQPDNYVTLYNGLSLRGLWALFRETGDAAFAEIIRAQSKYVLAMRDHSTRLFYHTAWSGKVEKNPQFVAGAGMILLGLHDVSPLVGSQAVPEDTVFSVLNRAHPNGSYPGFIGKNDTGRPGRSGGGIVWEDVAASANWNAQWFEYLTRLVDIPALIDENADGKTVHIVRKRFVYIDSPKTIVIGSWWPPRSWGLYWFVKNRPKARLSLFPHGLWNDLRTRLRRNSR